MDYSSSPAVSPTGTPVIPPAVVPWILGVTGIAGVGAALLPHHTIGWKLAAFIVSLGGLFGAASPGLRRNDAP